MLKTILEIWFFSGILAFISFPVTTYLMVLINTDIRPTFLYHLWVVNNIVGGLWEWVKFLITSIALGPIGLIAFNVIVMKMYTHDDKNSEA